MNALIDQAFLFNGYMQTMPSKLQMNLKTDRMNSTVKHSLLLVDYPFLCKEIKTTLNLLADDYPDRQFGLPEPEEYILSGIRALHQKAIIKVVIFHDESLRHELSSLNGAVLKYPGGEAEINTCCDTWYKVELCNHMTAFGSLYDEVLLLGDDQIYILPLLDVQPITRVKLLRRDNRHTLYRDTPLAQVRWQDIYYVVGMTLGLHEYEM